MELKYIEKKEKINEDGDHYTREVYSIGDYTIEVDDVIYKDGAKYHSIHVVQPYNRIGEERYIPDIYYHDGYFDHREPHFSIQTVSYGSLEPDDFKKFLAAQEAALEIAEVLTRELIATPPAEQQGGRHGN